LLKLKIVLPLSWVSGKRLLRSACRTRWVRQTDAAWDLLLLLLVSQWQRCNSREIRREGYWPPISDPNNDMVLNCDMTIIIIIITSYNIIGSYYACSNIIERRRTSTTVEEPRRRYDYNVIVVNGVYQRQANRWPHTYTEVYILWSGI